MNELENLREKIDTIDREMIALFEKRMDVVCDIAKYKKKNKLPILNQGREDIVISKVKSIIKNNDYTDSAAAFIKEVMGISKDLQQKIIHQEKNL